MSETKPFDNRQSAPGTQWPTPEELTEIIKKILIPDKWKAVKAPLDKYEEVKRPITAEYLQKLGERLADEPPMSYGEWNTILKELYNKVNYSKQPEAQRLWELFLEKGIQELSKLIASATAEEIHKQANADPYFNEHKDSATKAMARWNEGVENSWDNAITRMLDTDAGTTEETIIRLSKKMIELVSVPFTNKILELDPDIDLNIKPPVRFSKEMAIRGKIANVVRCMEIAQDHLRPIPLAREQLEANISTITEKIIAKITSS
ncbi:MAG TPA: hypothetical protein DEB09_02530 [Candidatus Magasanikbacteria bacterium]|nr:hypothetical protein [Candidatus Magasanikbacteria bacterium]